MSVDIDLTGWLETALPGLLPAFLQQQRWFRGKAKATAGVDFEDAAWIADGGRPCAVVIVNVRYGQAAQERYALVLAFDRPHKNLPTVGQLEPAGEDAWVFEAATDSAAALALLEGFSSPLRNRPMVRGGELRYRDTSDATMRTFGGMERPAIRTVGAEQSNTSMRVGETLVFKLFRRFEDGENPELEIGRFLMTHTSFRAVPTLRGSLTYVPARGEPSTLGVLQDWVDNRGDGWSYVLGMLEQVASGSTGNTLLRDLFALGETTADCHAALSVDATVPAFAPEPVTGSDIEDWRASLLERVRSTMRLVERNMPSWSEDARQVGHALLDARVHVATLVHVPELRRAPERFRKIRVHGDFHLGQTLKTSDRFILIDFEGEPARPLAERRLKHCALKDVAGMIRSFDYAVETARLRAAKVLPESVSARHLRASFLDGYLEAARRRNAVFVPPDRRALDQWIDFFALEKALYEVEYEINNRPDWVHIPLRGILRFLEGRSS